MAIQCLEDNDLKNVQMVNFILKVTCAFLSYLAYASEFPEDSDMVSKDQENIEIDSDTLNFTNQKQKRIAIFEGNVNVRRIDMTMTSNKLTCYFNGNNEIHLIIAEGNVVITQNDTKALSEKAAYSPDEDKIILIKEPVVHMKDSTIHARRITIYQKTSDIYFDEPIMHTVIKDEQAK